MPVNIMYYSTFIITVNLILLVNNVKTDLLPSKCKLSDSACLTKVTNEFIPVFAVGLPDLGVKTLDPLHIKHINASVGSFKFIVNDNLVNGMKNTVMNTVKIDKTKSNMFLKFTCNGLMVSEYEISGNLLFLKIEGKGPFRAKMRGVEVHLNLNFGEEVGSDGKGHWKVSYKNYKIYTRDKCELEFDHLFDGNAILAAAAKEMISQNGNEIVKEIGLPIIKTIIDIIIDNMNDLFKVIPADDLYIN